MGDSGYGLGAVAVLSKSSLRGRRNFLVGAQIYQYVTMCMWQMQNGQLIESWRQLQDLSCREEGRVSFEVPVSDGESDCSQVEKAMEQPASS